MNGARTTFMRRGYLLTARAAAVLLAASPGTASAQSIGFVGSSGMVAETASMEDGALEGPHKITVRASGFSAAQRPTGVTLDTDADISYAIQSSTGRTLVAATDLGAADAAVDINNHFATMDEIVLLVAQDNNTGGTQDGSPDTDWLDEQIKLTLGAAAGTTISTNVYTVTVDDSQVAPVAKFTTPSFTLTEGSQRAVSLDIATGRTGTPIPAAATTAGTSTNDNSVAVRVSNHQMVTIGGADSLCPTRTVPVLGQSTTKAVHIALSTAWGTPDAAAVAAFGRTARLETDSDIATLAGTGTAGMTVMACNVSGFRNPQVTLTILPNNLVEPVTARVRGDITVGSPLVVTVDSDEAAPTLSFSPTDVTIDEGGSTSTRLIADGSSATEVGMVKLMVEGDAMVSLMHEDTMLEEVDGYVTVDMGMSNSARLTAMSHSDPDLMDGEMAYKAWKLMEGSSDAAIGDDYWFRVDVRGSTAVPALPLVGQLLLALFMMAGGSRLYRRRKG